MGDRARKRRSAGVEDRAPLVGRDGELGALRELLDALRRRREGGVAVIEGEVGVGKTRLLEEALASIEAGRLRVVRGGANELERERPFGVLADAFELAPDARHAQARELGELISGPQWRGGPDIATPDVRFRIVEGLLEMIERLAAQKPLVLAIEDLHWADPSTLLTLHRMSRRLADIPAALLCTCRPHPRAQELTALLAALPAQSAHLKLQTLDSGGAHLLASALLGAEVGSGLADQLEGTGGNPLFVVELIAALRDEGVLRLAGGRADVRGTSLPPTLQLTILRRLSFLREDVLETLRAASALGSSFSVADLALLLGRPIPDLLGPLGEALDAEVLRGDGDSLRFRHDLLREAIYADLADPLRAGLHLQAGRTFAAAGRPPAQAATHFALGAPPGDREAVDWLRRGAAETAPGAPGVAARFLRQAAELLPEQHRERRAIRTDLTRCLLWAGELAAAEQMARDLLREAIDPDGAAALHYAVGRALAYQGRLEESIEHVHRALDDARLAPHDRARLLAELSHRRLLSGDVAGAARAAEEATSQGDPVARWTALCARAWAAACQGELARAEALAAEAVATADPRPDDPVARIQPRLYHGFTCIDADRFEQAEELLRDGLALAEQLGATWALPLHHAGLALVHWHSGAWDDAVSEAETSLVLADELETRVWKPAAYGVLVRIALHRDDFARVERLLHEADAEPASRSARFWSDGLAVARALLVEARGDGGAALGILAERWSSARGAGSVGDWRATAPQLVRLSLLAGRPEIAADVTAALQALPVVNELPAAAGLALLCRGMLEGDAKSLARAETTLRDCARPLEHAAAAEAAAGVLGGEGAAALLRKALLVYEACGAVRDVARTEAALRELGFRRGSRGRRKRPSTGWESLTPSEQRIASLVAEGLTNREIAERLFLSRRTVETHVSHALAKLNLSSRVQLATEAARREPARAQADPTAPSAGRANR